MATSDPIAPAFSRPVATDDIGEEGLRLGLTASARAREELARLNGLLGVALLEASLVLRRERRRGLRVTGDVRARVTQTCVVSLDAFEADVIVPVEVHYLPSPELAAYRAARAELDADSDQPGHDLDEPDLLPEGGVVDLGTLASEHLTLGLDPYPKKPGVSFVEPAPSAVEPEASPFAALKSLQRDPR